MKIVFLTAGAAGMYCGSCMHDNAIAKALRAGGDDVLLQPVYTPIRTDESSIASDEVFFGGIHVYLLQQMPWLRWLPRWTRSWMDRPGLIRMLTKKAVKTDPAKLGALTISMLRGEHGRQSEEVSRLVDWLERDIQPDAIIFSNLLIGGAIPTIRRRLPQTRLVVTLQGDDIFLDHLPDDARSEAIALCAELSHQVDVFVTHSEFYRDKMGAILGVGPDRFDLHPLSIDLQPFQPSTHPGEEPAMVAGPDDEFRIGYLARIAPEKGLHHLVDAFLRIASRPEHANVTLHAAGWLGEHNVAYLNELKSRVADAGLADRFVVTESPEQSEKISLLKSMNVLSVPAPYEDPKGLFLLEAMACGVPVVQPDHGAFSELVRSTGGGVLFHPEDTEALVHQLIELRNDPDRRASLGETGRQSVHQRHHIESAAEHMRRTCQRS
ncbi:glycosyltransferase family 4 protein [Rhodopirellula sp. JC740]|uniref:Glycosyltransferase family 4 protein n=1 Tax=Rhodopirellula halodulae TaxID=2894198 RepID=A0ABS8NHM3_9BACT|nr:glycosyltransferase family 4 protein [Rhodopirellula sp. JC740]MCC9643054.1 glycosyltransferase family 4 protein [Rhodopirellula sp. JC740]